MAKSVIDGDGTTHIIDVYESAAIRPSRPVMKTHPDCSSPNFCETVMEKCHRVILRVSCFTLAIVLAGLSPANANNVCRDVPTEFQDQKARQAFGDAESASFLRSRAPLEAALDSVCTSNDASARQFRAKAKKVVIRMAAGATEPSPYFEDGTLIVEFYGGNFQAARFRQEVRDALRGKPSRHND